MPGRFIISARRHLAPIFLLVLLLAVAATARQAAAPPGLLLPGALVRQGEMLAAIGNCASCHTVPGGSPYAGGVPLKTPFGIIYGTNITPEPQTGIGAWSEAEFRRAMRRGSPA